MADSFAQVKTIWHDILTTCKEIECPFPVIDHSTLNQHFGIQNGVVPPDGVYPKISYIAIGNGGHNFTPGIGGIAIPDTKIHLINNARLFHHIPFIMREVSNDLSVAERARFRLRRLETHNGKQYFVYYLMKVIVNTVAPTLVVRDTTVSPATNLPYIPTVAQQTPKAATLVNGRPNLNSGKSIITSVPLKIILNAEDISEIKNCMNIIHKDERLAYISEVAVCSAADSSVTTSLGGVNVTYTEAIAVQIMAALGGASNLVQTSGEVVFDYRLGSVSSLLS